MAAFLCRLGRLAFRRRWYVALLWVAVLAAVGFGAAKAPAAPDATNSMPGIESQKAFDLLEQRFPGARADGANARIVFVAPDGEKMTRLPTAPRWTSSCPRRPTVPRSPAR